MEVIFYYNASDPRYSVKSLTQVDTCSGSFKQPFNIMDPILQLSKAIDPLVYNYCYIQEVDRYYFVSSQPSYEAGYYNVSLHNDVIVNLRDEYMELGAIIARQEHKFNAYLNDSRYPVINKQEVTTVLFPDGFSDSHQEILIPVNGGGGI